MRVHARGGRHADGGRRGHRRPVGGDDDSGRRPFYLTINPDRTLTAAWGAATVWGPVTAGGGKAGFEMPPGPYEGIVQLDGDGGTSRLALSDPGASLDHDVTEGIQSRGLDCALSRPAY